MQGVVKEARVKYSYIPKENPGHCLTFQQDTQLQLQFCIISFHQILPLLSTNLEQMKLEPHCSAFFSQKF
eukprot:TRINITY_DN17300_c0_g1_i1.p2 TRINITY_DN17300_c0_g1~~TRINITY_DN17300_c0_g1_i1.p2  ORF type:complete len:70 (+),score=7.92 TRINITY_DN17300_c0_g1_i1:99-308(+)